MNDEARETIHDFRDVVNMAPQELEEWLDTDESKEVCYKDE